MEGGLEGDRNAGGGGDGSVAGGVAAGGIDEKYRWGEDVDDCDRIWVRCGVGRLGFAQVEVSSNNGCLWRAL